MFKGRLPIKNAPWYNMPFEDLDFEWTAEEKMEIERYSEKLLSIINDEGGMTPVMRMWLLLMEDIMHSLMLAFQSATARRFIDNREVMSNV